MNGTSSDLSDSCPFLGSHRQLRFELNHFCSITALRYCIRRWHGCDGRTSILASMHQILGTVRTNLIK